MANPLEKFGEETKKLTEKIDPLAVLRNTKAEMAELSGTAAHKLSPSERAQNEIDKLILNHKAELDRLQKEAEQIIKEAVENLNPNEGFLQYPSDIANRPVVLRETAMKLYMIAQRMAKILGCELAPSSSYRSVNYQQFIWKQKFEECKLKWKKQSRKEKINLISGWENNPSLKTASLKKRKRKINEWEKNDEAIKRWARSSVAPPGGSPHHTGGAIDIGGKNHLKVMPVSKEYENALRTSNAPEETFKKLILREIMTKAGFENYEMEPWHWEVFTERWAHHKTHPLFSWQKKWEKPLWKGKSMQDEPSWSKILSEDLGQPICPVYPNKDALYRQEHYYKTKIPYVKTGDIETIKHVPKYKTTSPEEQMLALFNSVNKSLLSGNYEQDPPEPDLAKSSEKITKEPSELTQKAINEFEHIFTHECPSTTSKCYYFLSPDREIIGDDGPEHIYYRIPPGKDKDSYLLERKAKLKYRTGRSDDPDWEDWEKGPRKNTYSKRDEIGKCIKNIGELQKEYPDKEIIPEIEKKFAEEFYETPLGRIFNDKFVHRYLIHGLIVLESSYDPRSLSGEGALGIWQLMPDTAKEVGLKVQIVDFKTFSKSPGTRTEKQMRKQYERYRETFSKLLKTKTFQESIKIDERIDPEKSTKAAVLSLNKNFEYFKQAKTDKGEPILDYLMETYNLSPEDFLLPLVIDSHHSGMGNVRKMLEWFANTYSKEKIQEVYGNGPYGKDIYFLISKLYEKTRGKNGSNNLSYGHESRDYYLKAMAMYQGLKKGNGLIPKASFYMENFGRKFSRAGRLTFAGKKDTPQQELEALANDFTYDLKLIEILFNNKNFPKESLHNFAYHRSEEVRILLAKSPYAWENTYAVIVLNEKSEKVIAALAGNKKCPKKVLSSIYKKYYDKKYRNILLKLAGNINTPQEIIDKMEQRELFK